MSIISALLGLSVGFIIVGAIGTVAAIAIWLDTRRYLGPTLLNKIGFFAFLLMFLVGTFMAGGLG